ncbi:hypothetical protein [Actinocrispum sp. NPDC049592]|uniref:hypothetical protein n=1 Tax=Actinocrispum sp. NPDC049592 TaxID=3154835 RepID=UPI0034136FA0
MSRRVHYWPSAVLTAVFTLLGIWAFISATEKMGLTVDSPPEVRRGATAQIDSCTSDALYMWLTSRCSARVQWPGESTAVTVTVRSTHDLSDLVYVLERQKTRRSVEVVANDYPVKVDGALYFVMMMALLSLGPLGWLLGTRVARLLPGPAPKDEKLRFGPARHKG